MPAASTVFLWLSQHTDFSEQYARAKDAMAEAILWDSFDIADDGRNDTYTDGDGLTHVNYDHIQRSKLRVDIRKWALARMAPKKYGDRIQNEITNPDGSLRGATPEQIAAKLEAIQKRAAQRKAKEEQGDEYSDLA